MKVISVEVQSLNFYQIYDQSLKLQKKIKNCFYVDSNLIRVRILFGEITSINIEKFAQVNQDTLIDIFKSK